MLEDQSNWFEKRSLIKILSAGVFFVLGCQPKEPAGLTGKGSEAQVRTTNLEYSGATAMDYAFYLSHRLLEAKERLQWALEPAIAADSDCQNTDTIYSSDVRKTFRVASKNCKVSKSGSTVYLDGEEYVTLTFAPPSPLPVQVEYKTFVYNIKTERIDKPKDYATTKETRWLVAYLRSGADATYNFVYSADLNTFQDLGVGGMLIFENGKQTIRVSGDFVLSDDKTVVEEVNAPHLSLQAEIPREIRERPGRSGYTRFNSVDLALGGIAPLAFSRGCSLPAGELLIERFRQSSAKDTIFRSRLKFAEDGMTHEDTGQKKAYNFCSEPRWSLIPYDSIFLK